MYASHGAGHVAARETRTHHGTRQEVIVLALADGLSVPGFFDRFVTLLAGLGIAVDVKAEPFGVPVTTPWQWWSTNPTSFTPIAFPSRQPAGPAGA